ncbi:MAG: ferritin-like domain-containing protein [Simplicispira sp.]|nr:ferritin-like domain-containing protein [Simplicispira sp.]
METKTPLGMNRTGVQMSPLDTAEMQASLNEFAPPLDAERGDLQIRQEYADASEGLGSVPLPGTLKGMVKSSVDMVTGKRPQVLIDKLGERLAFERGGVRLYDTLLVKCRATPHLLASDEMQTLMLFRQQEIEHLALVTQALRALGADPTAQTPGADLVGVESLGLVQAINDPRTSLVQSLGVILHAELIDNACWSMLIELARAAGHDDIAKSFALALQQEAQHLVQVRSLVSRLTLADASMVGPS